MYLIVGLGNPEKDYANTRHNMGFNVINKLAQKYEIEITKNNFKGLYGTGIIEGKKVLLLKPQTFMNLSGESILEAKNFYKIELEDILVIYDDIDTDLRKNKSKKTRKCWNTQWIKVCSTLPYKYRFCKNKSGYRTTKE